MALPPFILDKIVGSRSIGRMCNIPIKKGLLRGKKKEKKNKIGPLILLSGKEKEKKKGGKSLSNNCGVADIRKRVVIEV
jgi:hypothetical protein